MRSGGTWTTPSAVHVRSGGTWVVPSAIYVRTGGAWAQVTTGSGGGGTPPAVPTNVEQYIYNSVKIGVSWVTGEVGAQTKIYRRVSGAWTHVITAAVGETQKETGYTSGFFAVSHLLNGLESALVTAG